MDVFSGVIRLQDDVTGVLRGAAQAARNFQSDIGSVRESLSQLNSTNANDITVSANTDNAVSAIENVRTESENLSDRDVSVSANTEGAVSSIDNVRTETENLSDRSVSCLLYTSPSPRD